MNPDDLRPLVPEHSVFTGKETRADRYAEDQQLLLETFEKQCRSLGPETAFLIWHLSGELSDDILLDSMKKNGCNGHVG